MPFKILTKEYFFLNDFFYPKLKNKIRKKTKVQKWKKSMSPIEENDGQK